MTEIRPFRGWRFGGDVTSVIAPPYDILSADDKAALLAKSADNIVSVDLPHVPPKDVGPDEAYVASAQKLTAMQSSGKLMQEATPALYAYCQEHTWAGKTYARRALLCGVRATELGEGVWPHEKTFAGAKADRLKLTETTGVQLSPIFGFLDDVNNASEKLWAAVGDADPAAAGQLGPVAEKIWPVTDPDAIAAVRGAIRDVPIFIADGHHRYTTALNYRNTLRDAGKIDDEHEANFVLFALVAMDDPGLLVLPTHRMVRNVATGFGAAELAAELAGSFECKQMPITDELLETPDAALAPFGPHAMAIIDSALDAAHVVRLADPELMKRHAPDQCDAWRGLDVAILHRLLLEQNIAARCDGEPKIGYTAFGREVADTLKQGQARLAVLLQGTPLAAVKDVALAGEVMPHKSTYFYPKLATGMVLKPLT